MTIILIPQFTMIILAQQSSLMVQKDFNQVSAITFAVSIFLALSLPSLIIKMLVVILWVKSKLFPIKLKMDFIMKDCLCRKIQPIKMMKMILNQ